MKNGKWPEISACYFRPMDGSVMEHRAGDGENDSNVSFSNAIGVVCSYTGVMKGLSEFFKMCCKVFVGKGCPVVTEELLWDYAMSEAHRVVGQLGL